MKQKKQYEKIDFWWSKNNKWSYGHRWYGMRHQKTAQEIRENDFFDNYDDYKTEYKIKFRRSRSKKNIPTCWDDYWIYSQRSWKTVFKVDKQWKKNI